MRFYLDEDLSYRIAELGRSVGLDVTSSHESGQNGKSDEEQLLFAADQSRCLVTGNRNHFMALTVRSFEDGLPHHGVLIISPQMAASAFRAVVDALTAYDREHPEGAIPYTVDFLHPYKVH